jgi:uncharacterized membrane protein
VSSRAAALVLEDNIMKTLGVLLLVLGVLALAYKGFSYTKETHKAKLGPIDIAVEEKKSVDIPTWAGVVALVVGGGLLLTSRRT